MKLRQTIFNLALAAAALPLAAQAGDAGTLYTQLSTNGIGVGYGASLSERWALRGQYNTYSMNFSGDVSDIGNGGNSDIKVKLNSFQLLGDWYPGEGGFRLSMGVVANDNKITLDGTGNVNGKTATINGEVKLSDTISPYLGIGYSVRPRNARGWGFIFDLGIMGQTPKVTLNATGGGVTQGDIDAQKAKIEDAVNKLRIMPVIGLGVSYSF